MEKVFLLDERALEELKNGLSTLYIPYRLARWGSFFDLEQSFDREDFRGKALRIERMSSVWFSYITALLLMAMEDGVRGAKGWPGSPCPC